jgi:hypothetical protein
MNSNFANLRLLECRQRVPQKSIKMNNNSSKAKKKKNERHKLSFAGTSQKQNTILRISQMKDELRKIQSMSVAKENLQILKIRRR